MANRNYIAVGEKGKIYRLNHDHKERVKLIVNQPNFLKYIMDRKMN